MSADSSQSRTERISREQSGGSATSSAIVRSPGSETPSVAATGSALPPSFDSERTVISKDTPVAVALPMTQLPPAEMGKLLEGQRLGHFELQEFVGGGGMGAVFR